MKLVRTPLRVSIIGGGTDFAEYYEKETGAVISMAINKYVYIGAIKKFDDKIRLSYSKNEIVNNIMDLQHGIAREVLNYFGLRKSLEIITFSEVPAQGTGLGSSSSFTVGFINLCLKILDLKLDKNQIAELASEIEIEKLHKNIGKQDQYAASVGGFNLIEFQAKHTTITPLNYSSYINKKITDNLLLIYIGQRKNSEKALIQTKRNIKHNKELLDELVKQTYLTYDKIKDGDIDYIGTALNIGWKIKIEMLKRIDMQKSIDMIDFGIKCGALGGKILGAGGDKGFILFYAPKKRKKIIMDNFKNYKIVDFQIDTAGTVGLI